MEKSKQFEAVCRTPRRREVQVCELPTLKHGGGSLQVWGSITYSGVGHLCKITDNLTTPKYKQILIHHAVLVGKALIGNNFVFHHDYGPKHTGRQIKKCLENKKREGSLTVLNWPAQSSNMNIIEQACRYIKKEKVKKAPVNLQQLGGGGGGGYRRTSGETFQFTLSRNFMTVFHVMLMKCAKPKGSILNIESVIYQLK